MQRIHVLDPLLANQIAAGEVIERPASIVKELLENCLDAGATRIEIDIEQAGKKLIRIRDNGSGIHPDDLALSLSRHATSKIHKPQDLSGITSLGFRGEALASIAAVAQVRLTSRNIDVTAGHEAYCSGRDTEIVCKPASHPQGTTVEVEHLFFNTPARKKFLKSDQTEFQKIQEVVKHIALLCNQVSFTLRHNGRRVLQLSAGSSEHSRQLRVSKICGKAFIEHAVHFSMAGNDLTLQGYLGLPEVARSHADIQYFYINGRIIRDKLILHAIREAYADLLYPGKYPAYVLFLTMPVTALDVNVHPTKHEVRFHESRWVHDFISKTLREALQDADEPVLLSDEHEVLTAPAERSEHPAVDSVVANVQEKVAAKKSALPSYAVEAVPSVSKQQRLDYFEQLIGGEPDVKATQPKPAVEAKRKISLVQMIEQAYALISMLQGFWLVDLKEVLAEHTTNAWTAMLESQTNLLAAPLLLPQTIDCHDAELVVSLPVWATFGFDVSAIGPEQLVLRAAPEPLTQCPLETIINALIQLEQRSPQASMTQRIELLATTAAPLLAKAYSAGELLQILHEILPAKMQARYAKEITPELCQKILTNL